VYTLGLLEKIGLRKERRSEVYNAWDGAFGEGIARESREAINFFKDDPVIFGACQSRANWVSATDLKFEFAGARGTGKTKLAQMNAWAQKIKFRSKLRNIALTHILFDDVFLELDFKLKDFHILDSETVKIKYNRHGVVTHYEQQVNGRRITLPPEKIVHFKMNTAGSEMLGISPMVPLYKVIKSKRITEEYTNMFFRRHATPRLVYTFPEVWSDKQMKRFLATLKHTTPHADLIVPSGVEVKVVGSVMSDMQFEKWLEYQRNEILIAMGLFPILLGLPEGSNKANSSIQFDAFRLSIRADQNELETVFNTEIFPALHGTTDVIMKFKGLSLAEYAKKADILRTMSFAFGNLVDKGIYSANDAKIKFDDLVEGL
jgi:hypothetical protein